MWVSDNTPIFTKIALGLKSILWRKSAKIHGNTNNTGYIYYHKSHKALQL